MEVLGFLAFKGVDCRGFPGTCRGYSRGFGVLRGGLRYFRVFRLIDVLR